MGVLSMGWASGEKNWGLGNPENAEGIHSDKFSLV